MGLEKGGDGARAGYYSEPMWNSLRTILTLSGRVLRRFLAEGLDQTSASLAFTTLLSLVPLVALVLSIAALAPEVSVVIEQIDRYIVRNLLPTSSAGVITAKVAQFSHKAAHLTVVGVAFMLFTTVLLLNTIERAFNQVWRVSAQRAAWRHALLYLVVLAFWPLLVGGLLAAVSHAITLSLGLLNEPLWLRHALFRLLAVAALALFFSFFYYAMPNAPVALRHAGAAGLAAAMGFVVLQRAFEWYLAHFPSYTTIYGAFATVPIFLLWLYLSWAVVLLGAAFAAELPEAARPASRSRRVRARRPSR